MTLCSVNEINAVSNLKGEGTLTPIAHHQHNFVDQVTVGETSRLKTPSPQHTTALWGRTDGANLRYGLP
jgi:hypothetical protein